MSNDKRPGTIKEENRTSVTITPAKASSKYINKMMRMRETNWLNERKSQKWCLKILEVIPEGDEKNYRFIEQQEAQAAEVERWEKEQSEERQRKLQEKYQRLKQDREQQQQKQKQRKKKQRRDDDDDTVTTEITQESSLECEEIECNLIEDEDDQNEHNIVIIPTQVLYKMKQNLNWKSKWKQKWQKEKYSRKVKMKKKIARMKSNITNEYPTSEENVSKQNETKGILKLID